VVRADLKRLGLAHDESDLAGLLVLEKLDGAGAPFLPLVPVFVKSVQLRLPAKTQISTKSSGAGNRARQ